MLCFVDPVKFPNNATSLMCMCFSSISVTDSILIIHTSLLAVTRGCIESLCLGSVILAFDISNTKFMHLIPHMRDYIIMQVDFIYLWFLELFFWYPIHSDK